MTPGSIVNVIFVSTITLPVTTYGASATFQTVFLFIMPLTEAVENMIDVVSKSRAFSGFMGNARSKVGRIIIVTVQRTFLGCILIHPEELMSFNSLGFPESPNVLYFFPLMIFFFSKHGKDAEKETHLGM